MKILVTGHLGFIGSHLTPYLKTFYKREVIGLDIKEGNDILECDLPDADVVIHLAAIPGVIASMADPFANARTNILGTIRLLQRYPNARFIFSSSGGTIQEKIESPYGLSKLTCEKYIKMLSNDYNILRFCNVYGEGSRSVIDKFLKDDIVIYGDGSATRTYGHINDILRAILMAFRWPKGSYFLGSDQNYSVLQIAEAVGKPITFKKKRAGELDHSSLKNITPDWEPMMDVMEYIQLCNSR
jgi:UDP-glucose 4-epimerase